MIDLETTLADQDDLERLCEPHPDAPDELYWCNGDYGFARVLKEYAGYPIDKPVHAVVPHGVSLGDMNLYEGDIVAPVPAVFSYPAHRNPLYTQQTSKKVIPSASPFLYALKMLEGAPSPERGGTLYFHAHSTNHHAVEIDIDDVLGELDALPDRCKPVTACVYFWDVYEGVHRRFDDAGIRTVSAGHINDPQFTYRLGHLMSTHTYAVGNELGSSVFYATAAGLPFAFLDTRAATESDQDAARVLGSGMSDARREKNTRIWDAFAELAEVITPEQQELTEYHLGAKHLKSREGLLRDLEYVATLAR